MTWRRNRHLGLEGEAIIQKLLEDSGYQVIHHGFEFLSNLTSRLRRKKRTDCRDVERQIRSTPDFVVFDPPKHVGGGYIREEDLMLVEVKTRSLLTPNKSNFLLYKEEKKDQIEDYLKYWNNTLLVVIIPKYNFFYATKIKNLQPNKFVYNANKDFQKIQKIFTRITDDIIKKYQSYVKDIFYEH